MKLYRLFVSWSLIVPAFAAAQPAPAPDKMQELERKIDVLSQEVERLKLGAPAAASPAASGLIPHIGSEITHGAALGKLSIGAYGEFVIQHFARRNQKADTAARKDRADLRRFVLEAGYRFNDEIRFKSEVEFEHAGTGEGAENRGEVSLEQAYLDFAITEPLGLRAGLLLMPMGFINETHEPPYFHGVNRPNVEQLLIPSTWRENGAGIFGKTGMFSYRSYVVAGLTAIVSGNPTLDGFTGSSGIRGGRSGGSNSFAEDAAWVSRLDVSPVAGVTAGGSFYLGEADHNLTAAAIPVTLWEAHAQAECHGAELKAIYVESTVGNADVVNRAQLDQNAAFTDFVGRRQFGGYVQGAFNVLSLDKKSKQYLAPFFRYERYDTQSQVPRGFVNDAANSRVDYTAGLTYKPIPEVAVKADYQWRRNQARTGVNQINLGLGFVF